jgi:hypothetical protein
MYFLDQHLLRHQLERTLGATYKTEPRIATLIRNELMDDDRAKLSGQAPVP